MPISDDLQKLIRAALPFGDCYKKFGEAVVAVKLDLPVGQLTHVLRHTFASHYMMNGGDIITLQRVLGHASLAMTMKYAHFSPGHLAEVVTLNPLTVVQSGRMARRGELERASETVNADHFREPADLAVMANAAGVEMSEAS